jgi:hypothetical protein
MKAIFMPFGGFVIWNSDADVLAGCGSFYIAYLVKY